nr:photosystem II protein M [Cephaleuros parasiticus]UIB38985.1 photosystem II protein M [Cephaleuros parasiticus]
MEINILGLLATVLFIIIPSAFLIILYTSSTKQKAGNSR